MSGDGGYTLGDNKLTTADGIVEQGVATTVNVESVAAAVDWLDGLKHYIQDRLIPDVGKMTLTKGDADVWFGGLDSAAEVTAKHSAYVKAVIESYRGVAQALDTASRATRTIVKNYRDVEHNNAVTTRNIDAAFAPGGSPAGPAPSGSADHGSY